MEAHQQRVVDEQTELDDKIGKLQNFISDSPIFIKLDKDDRVLLDHQLSTMRNYSKILGERIKRFKS